MISETDFLELQTVSVWFFEFPSVELIRMIMSYRRLMAKAVPEYLSDESFLQSLTEGLRDEKIMFSKR